MEMPPSIPKRGLKVLWQSVFPQVPRWSLGALPHIPSDGNRDRYASRIICRGTRLMAADPTGWSNPGLVTRPTPGPPSMEMPG